MSTDPSPGEDTHLTDPESASEMARLIDQDHLVTQQLGGLFPEAMDVSGVHDILDLACGPGGWARDVAYTHPEMTVVGLDVSRTVVEYAQAQAQVQRLDNVTFLNGNILLALDFPDNSFDLINARFIAGFTPRTVWPKIIRECLRVTRPGGILCLTEPEMNFATTPAFVKMAVLGTQAIKRAGLGFSLDGHQINITPMLGRLLRDAGYQNIRKRAHVIDFSTGEDAHQGFFENYMVAAQLAKPFLLAMKMATTEELDQLYHQMLTEMMQDDFQALWFLLSVWGEKPKS